MTQEEIKQRLGDKIKVDPSGCWLWQGYKDKNYGYGRIKTAGKPRSTHRVVYCWRHDIRVESFSSEIIVRHTCDTPACINPDHLLSGTYKDNSHDAMERDRLLRGERSKTAVLTKAQALEIAYSMLPNGCMADKIGVSVWVVHGVRSGKTWHKDTGISRDAPWWPAINYLEEYTRDTGFYGIIEKWIQNNSF